MRIFVIGPPGSGKNVIAQHLADHFHSKHLNYRTLVIDAYEQKTALGKKLYKYRNHQVAFPAEEAFMVIKNTIESSKLTSFVLEGYPKSAEEAKYIREFLLSTKKEDNHTFFIDSSREIIKKRLGNRLVCPNCSYLLYDSNPDSILTVECMNCHVPLIKRQDDTDEGIKNRVARFVQEKSGIMKELSQVSVTYTLGGSPSISKIINEIIDVLEGESSTNQAEKGARLLIENLGLNLADPNYIGTPARLVKSLRDLMIGQDKDAQRKIRDHLNKVFPTRYKGMIIMEPIRCISLCSHHLLPVSYEILFGYIPKDKSLGFSKIIKVINVLGAKPSLQEDFTQEVIDTFDQVLDPKGIMLVVRGRHSCMTLRGEKSENINITSALRGIFKDEKSSRDEFLALAKFSS